MGKIKREVYGILSNGERVCLGYLMDEEDLSVSDKILNGFANEAQWFNLGSCVYRYDAFIGIQITPQYLETK